MSRFKITREYAEALLAAFREVPGNGTYAAARAECHPATALRAWRQGIKHSPWPEYRVPFRDIIAREQEEIRAKAAAHDELVAEKAAALEAARRQKVRTRALEDLTEERVQETQLVRTARTATLALLSNLTQLSVGANALGRQVREALEARAADPSPMSLREVVDVSRLVGRLATALRQCNDAGQRAMEMTRLLVGEPQQIHSLQLEAVGVQEAQQRLEAAARAVAQAAEQGLGQLDGNVQAVRQPAAEDEGPVH